MGNINVNTSSNDTVSDSTIITEGTVSANAPQFNLRDVIVLQKGLILEAEDV